MHKAGVSKKTGKQQWRCAVKRAASPRTWDVSPYYNMPSYCFPIDPIRERIELWLAEAEGVNDVSPSHILARKIWPHFNTKSHACDRRLWEVRNHAKFIGFDLADKILCAMDDVWAWHEDPALNEIYWRVNLKRLDEVRPCC